MCEDDEGRDWDLNIMRICANIVSTTSARHIMHTSYVTSSTQRIYFTGIAWTRDATAMRRPPKCSTLASEMTRLGVLQLITPHFCRRSTIHHSRPRTPVSLLALSCSLINFFFCVNRRALSLKPVYGVYLDKMSPSPLTGYNHVT